MILQNILKNSTMWLRDTGVLAKMRDDELSAPMPIPDQKIKDDGHIDVEHIGIGLAIYSVGMTLSLLLFIGELCTKGRVKREEKQQWQARKAMEPLHENNGNDIGLDIIISPQMGHQSVSHK